MKKNYKNYIKSQERKKNAVLSLLAEKSDLSEITVSETVKLAKINRGTFYNHYSNVYEVLDDIENDLVNLFTNDLKKEYGNNLIEQFFANITKYFTENKAIYKKLVKNLSNAIINGIKEKFFNLILSIDPTVDRFSVAFITHGFAGLYIDYLLGKTDFTLLELEQKSVKLIKDFSGIIDKTQKM